MNYAILAFIGYILIGLFIYIIGLYCEMKYQDKNKKFHDLYDWSKNATDEEGEDVISFYLTIGLFWIIVIPILVLIFLYCVIYMISQKIRSSFYANICGD